MSDIAVGIGDGVDLVASDKSRIEGSSAAITDLSRRAGNLLPARARAFVESGSLKGSR